jgi:CHAD domain-containing protein
VNALASGKRPVEGVRAAIVAECVAALDRLSSRPPSATDIHDTRKGLKKARAWLRLLRCGISARAFRTHNHALRDAARPLSEARDAQVLLETLDAILKRYRQPRGNRRFGRFARALREDRRAIRKQLVSSRTKLAASRRLLRDAKAALSRVRIASDDWNVIGASFAKVYAAARHGMHVARADPSPECLHEWRKRTKNFLYQLEMLEPLWPGVIEEWADQAHQLADYLGDDHDLAVLREAAKEKGGAFDDPAHLDALLALIDRRRKQLQDKAFLLGARLYEPRVERLRARFEKYWRLWLENERPDP